jgi:hypothetical protein
VRHSQGRSGSVPKRAENAALLSVFAHVYGFLSGAATLEGRVRKRQATPMEQVRIPPHPLP